MKLALGDCFNRIRGFVRLTTYLAGEGDRGVVLSQVVHHGGDVSVCKVN